ncbi:MAG TPA: DNA polymerase/3'-5' exonuclease PolX [Candidatus Acidoferrales bacterium]|nr:DNA polymerase/3'-5' exonuclease PolX [Candidatus Acidoferrales bacterium]
MENRDVARILRETAQLLEIDGAIIGRYRSYERAAELIEGLPDRVETLAADPEKLTALPGIGDRMAEHIQEVLKTGDYALRKKLLKKYPHTLLDVLTLQSLGPKKAALLWKTFKAGSVEAVEKLAQEGKLRDLAGFGEKSEQNILRAVEVFKKASGRFLLNVAQRLADELSEHIRKLGRQVVGVQAAGSLRRSKETVGDLDLLVTMPEGHAKPADVAAVSDEILKFPGIQQVLARGENKVSFVLENGMQVDVRLLPPSDTGAALIYFTGSKEHNVTLRQRALKMGYTLNEYALSRLKDERTAAARTEEDIYKKLGLAWIPPELRENTGEIEAAEEGRLPHLVERKDIRGDLQMHTTASDGKNSILEMAEAAKALGHEYISFTDHSKAVTVANGLDEKRMLAHIQAIRAAQKEIEGIRLLASCEVDILKDGALDMDDEVLAQLDVVLCSVHSYMNLDRAAMTDRMVAALENPYAQIIGHPTGRLLLRRDGFEYDMERILKLAHERGVAMECNSFPDRLDLRDTHLRMAKEAGVKITISTDAHSTANLELIDYGVRTARRGWIEPGDVLNTLPCQKLLAALRPKPGASAAPEPSTGTKPIKEAAPSLPAKTRKPAAGAMRRKG